MRKTLILLSINIFIALLVLTLIPLPVYLPSQQSKETLEFILPTWKNIQLLPFIANSFSDGTIQNQISVAIESAIRYFVGIVTLLSVAELVYIRARKRK